jgi:hypothetical protein
VPASVEHLLDSPARVAAAGLVIAVACLIPRWGWRIGRLAVTAAHEAGHALAVLIVGGRVRAVHLRADTSGLTWHDGVRSRGSRLVVAAAGYPAPGVAGVAGAGLIAAGRPAWWLAGLALFGAVEIVLWVRNLFGVAVTLVAVGALCSCLAFAPPTEVALAAAATAWFLTLGGLRASLEALRATLDALPARLGTQPRRGLSDAGELARDTRIPAGCFRFGFVLVAALCVAGCGLVLFPLPK